MLVQLFGREIQETPPFWPCLFFLLWPAVGGKYDGWENDRRRVTRRQHLLKWSIFREFFTNLQLFLLPAAKWRSGRSDRWSIISSWRAKIQEGLLWEKVDGISKLGLSLRKLFSLKTASLISQRIGRSTSCCVERAVSDENVAFFVRGLHFLL